MTTRTRKDTNNTEAQQWYFRLMYDPELFEKERFIDAIDDYNMLIA
jgi:hypothetical protein